MGNAIDWQTDLTVALAHLDAAVFNPRRDDWDSTWRQEANHPEFHAQVTWELNHLDACDVAAFRFDPAGPAPVTLLELGLYAASGKVLVCCPQGYWRRGNVEITCMRAGITFTDDAEEFTALTKARLEALVLPNSLRDIH